MGQKVAGSRVLVTGANRGLGRAIVQTFLEADASVVYACARTDDGMEGLNVWRDSRVVPLRLDVNDPASIEAAAGQVPKLDVLVNNAGIARSRSIFDDDGVERLRRQFETNTFGPLLVTRAFRRALAVEPGGTVVNILSVLSWLTTRRASGYAVAKAAAWSVTNATRGELREDGIHAIGVHVGYLDTDMTKNVSEPKLDPADLAAQIVAAVEAGVSEVLGDSVAREAKIRLAGGPEDLFLE